MVRGQISERKKKKFGCRAGASKKASWKDASAGSLTLMTNMDMLSKYSRMKTNEGVVLPLSLLSVTKTPFVLASAALYNCTKYCKSHTSSDLTSLSATRLRRIKKIGTVRVETFPGGRETRDPLGGKWCVCVRVSLSSSRMFVVSFHNMEMKITV